MKKPGSQKGSQITQARPDYPAFTAKNKHNIHNVGKEPLTTNQKVEGSSPSGRTTYRRQGSHKVATYRKNSKSPHSGENAGSGKTSSKTWTRKYERDPWNDPDVKLELFIAPDLQMRIEALPRKPAQREEESEEEG